MLRVSFSFRFHAFWESGHWISSLLPVSDLACNTCLGTHPGDPIGEYEYVNGGLETGDEDVVGRVRVDGSRLTPGTREQSGSPLGSNVKRQTLTGTRRTHVQRPMWRPIWVNRVRSIVLPFPMVGFSCFSFAVPSIAVGLRLCLRLGAVCICVCVWVSACGCLAVALLVLAFSSCVYGWRRRQSSRHAPGRPDR